MGILPMTQYLLQKNKCIHCRKSDHHIKYPKSHRVYYNLIFPTIQFKITYKYKIKCLHEVTELNIKCSLSTLYNLTELRRLPAIRSTHFANFHAYIRYGILFGAGILQIKAKYMNNEWCRETEFLYTDIQEIEYTASSLYIHK